MKVKKLLDILNLVNPDLDIILFANNHTYDTTESWEDVMKVAVVSYNLEKALMIGNFNETDGMDLIYGALEEK